MTSQKCNISLLVHTFNGYEFYWPGLVKGFRNFWKENIPLYLGTNTPHHSLRDLSPFHILYSGPGEWSDRLIRLLKQVNSEYIWYQQEDHWPFREPPKLDYLMGLVRKYSLKRLQISQQKDTFYSVYPGDELLFFNTKAKTRYLVSHQPSIWKKDFLESILEPNETPWINEWQGTARLWSQHKELEGKIAIYPYDWYKHKCYKGKFVEDELLS